MTKGQKAGDGPIAVEVEQDKSYYCAHVDFQKNNHSAMDHIMVQNLNLFHIKQ